MGQECISHIMWEINEYVLYDSIHTKLKDSSHNCVTFGRHGLMTQGLQWPSGVQLFNMGGKHSMFILLCTCDLFTFWYVC